ncbi:serine hydrolase domain-containing protein [Gymnodinialimonas sp.]
MADRDAQTKLIRSMMRPYESPHHAVVAFWLQDGEVTYYQSGPQISDARHEDWIFEIASITKVFTAILLCRLIEEGKIDPKAPVREMSDALKDVPAWITPERLTAHTSGLPNYYMPLWKAVFRETRDGPYADFSRSDLLAWCRQQGDQSPPSVHRHLYSNLGVGLLGEAMAIMEGQSFSDLLAAKVTGPLGLKDTTDRLSEAQIGRFAQPRAPSGKAVSPWIFQSLAAAGCLRSSAQDLACLAKAVIRAESSPQTVLDRAIVRSVIPIVGLGRGGAQIPTAQCSGWLQVTLDSHAPGYVFHNGGTAGSSCALYVSPERQTAFGILSNNGVAGNLWGATKLNWSNPMQKAHDLLALV